MNQEQLAVKLAQMKDLSEMMVDLAYSSLLYGSEEIANHVLEMEEVVDKLHTEFELTVLELRETRPVKGLLGLIRLALASEELADAAAMMANIVKRGVRAHPVMRRAMEQAEETIVATEIAQDSVICGKSLGELGLEDDIGMRIIAIRRSGDWMYNPSDAFVINLGDLIIARGYAEGREKLLTLANPMHTHG
jgi:uncharacterized protein with PhoU and TrkA domain